MSKLLAASLLFGSAGAGTKYTLSVAVKESVLQNIVLTAIAFCIVCTPVRRKITGCADRISAKNRRTYSAVRAAKTLSTAAVFILSFMTLVAYAGV
ncbi:hypothetical protein [uncultured Ruminococcus sp.]|uniref:hypothetical protein n=1 Tax=uncultured Ruminococcus sp. TaxID=165186 RepID=UPI0025ECE377|nr:hypothetical protein [uncultured Ruminococcus sp.]